MGVSSSKVVQREHAKRDDTSDSTPSCPSGTSWYNENCADPDQESHGCFDVDPCAGHTISSSSTHAATSASGGCNPPESFYDTSCDLPGWYFYGCFSPNPCVSASSAAAAESTTVAAPPTLTITKTNPAQTKTAIITTSSFSNIPHSSSNLPTSSQLVTTTSSSILAQTVTPVAAIPSAPVKPSLSPSPSHLDTAAVAAGTVGGVIGAIVALALMLLVLRWRKRRKGEILRTVKHENEVRPSNTDANGAGSSFHGSDFTPAYRDAELDIPLSSGTSNAGYDGDAAYKLSSLHSALLSPSPTQPDTKISSPTPDATRRQPELEVSAFQSPVELSPKTERSLINIPGQFPSPSIENSSAQSNLKQTADGPVMHPNLDFIEEGIGDVGAKKKGGGHIMSWMSYDGDGYGSGPER